MQDCVIQEQTIPEHLIGPLNECTSRLDVPGHIRDCLDEDGYVLLRGVLDVNAVQAARLEVFERLAEVGEIQQPAIEGRGTGTSLRNQRVGDLGAFWKSVSEGRALRTVSHGERLRKIMELVLGEPARPHDLMYLRPTPLGRSTRLHYDYPFFAGRSERIHTAWVPLGAVPICDGPLVIVEGSHQFDDLIDPIRNIDYAADHSNDTVQQAAYERQNDEDPLDMVRHRGTRFLTSEFHSGDVIIFSGFTMHGSLDNRSPQARVRLSVDVRFQPHSDPADDIRYFGPAPAGSLGGGYADMRGAQPLADS